MKKKIITLLILVTLVASLSFAGSLPDDIFSIRATGAYRQMTTYNGGSSNSVNKLLGVGFAFDYESYFNNYVGLYATVGLTIPVRSTIGETKIAISDSDIPAYSNFGFAGRIPMSNHYGLDFKLGFGVAYDRTVRYKYYWWNNYIEFSKVEYQMVAQLESYYNFDSEGQIGLKVGVTAAYTFATSFVESTAYSSRPTEIEDLRTTGFEILPSVGVVFGF